MLYPNPNFFKGHFTNWNFDWETVKTAHTVTPKTQSDIREKVRLLNRRLAFMLYPNPNFFKGHFTNWNFDWETVKTAHTVNF